MKVRRFTTAMIVWTTLFIGVGAAEEETNLGTISSSGGRTAKITKIEQRDGSVYLTAEGEAIIDVSKPTGERIAALEKDKPYVLPKINVARPFRYVLTDRTQDGLVVWKGTMVYVVLATQDSVPVFDHPGNTVTIAPSFNGEVIIAQRRLKAGDSWTISSDSKEGEHTGSSVPPGELLTTADILFLQGQNEEALATLEQVANMAVDTQTKVSAMARMAKVLDADGKTKEAQDLYVQALQLSTNPNTKAIILVGQTDSLLEQGRLVEARARIQEALGLATDPEAKAVAVMAAVALDVADGDVERGRKRFIDAGKFIETAIQAAEDKEKKVRLKMVLATILMAQERWTDVEETLDQSLTLTENVGTKCMLLQFQGGIFSHRRRTKRARQSFKNALNVAPTPDHEARCHTGLGEVAEYEGSLSEALAEYDRALAKATSNETRSLALFKKGTVLLEQGELKQGISAFEEVIRLTRSTHRKARSLANIGSALAGQGKITEARLKLEEALSMQLRPSIRIQIESALERIKKVTLD